ncbi:MAG: hypothetical protein HY094_03235 [Candidatus Melainabacteria bacterium]|nr:hypothetical protein [Candidatus Melainabacteria bacterium]
MIIDLISFSFKKNNLPEANYLIDVRFLNNPFYIDELRDLTGLDKEVIEFFKKDDGTKTFLKVLVKWIEYIIEVNKKANKEKISIAIGCTGGQHRSPYIVEGLAKSLINRKIISELSIYHNELKKYNVVVQT